MIMKKMLLLLLLLTACGENGTDESITYDGGRAAPPPAVGETITFEQFKEDVLVPWRCTACHQGGSGGTNWGTTDEEFKQGVLSGTFNRVRLISSDYDSDKSALYTRSGLNMPPGPEGPVDTYGLEYIKRFIEGLDTD